MRTDAMAVGLETTNEAHDARTLVLALALPSLSFSPLRALSCVCVLLYLPRLRLAIWSRHTTRKTQPRRAHVPCIPSARSRSYDEHNQLQLEVCLADILRTYRLPSGPFSDDTTSMPDRRAALRAVFEDTLPPSSPSLPPTSPSYPPTITPSPPPPTSSRRSGRGACAHAPGQRCALPAPLARGQCAAEEEQRARFVALAAEVRKERKALQLRCALVPRRRELLTEPSVRKEEDEAIRRVDTTRREKEGEAKHAERYKAALVEKGIVKPGDHPNIAVLVTEGLIEMYMQLAQLETGEGKEELNKRLRFVVRVDHIEHAYHKEERPLLAQGSRPRVVHGECLETKKWLVRMMADYEARRVVVLAKKGEEYAKDVASGKIEEENAKRKKTVLAKHEEELRASRRPSGKSRIESRRSTDSKRNALQKTVPAPPSGIWAQRDPSATTNTTVIALLDVGSCTQFRGRGRRRRQQGSGSRASLSPSARSAHQRSPRTARRRAGSSLALLVQ
ncbi:hypothetical protein B0H13DRAFT_2664708 [Mycena leptocephala]|nr:hypothetical protein B0H13DRAFT_2664708 [Mycena leptocephala]